MAVDDLSDLWAGLRQLREDVTRLQVGTPLQNSAITRGGLRVASMEGLIVEGTARTTGTQYINGRLEGDGYFYWTGPMSMSGVFTATGAVNLNGPTKIGGDVTSTGKFTNNGETALNGPTKINGSAEITGDVSLKSDLSIAVGGRIVAGAVTVGATGVISSTQTLRISGTSGIDLLSTTTVGGLLRAAGGLDTIGSKNFVMDHPMKPGLLLRHGATESPVSGIEYWGTGVIGKSGETTVKLPDYFAGLAKPESPTIFATGNGFAASWGSIEGVSFSVAGTPGGMFTWLVKAERVGGDFPVEEVGTIAEILYPEIITE